MTLLEQFLQISSLIVLGAAILTLLLIAYQYRTVYKPPLYLLAATLGVSVLFAVATLSEQTILFRGGTPFYLGRFIEFGIAALLLGVTLLLTLQRNAFALQKETAFFLLLTSFTPISLLMGAETTSNFYSIIWLVLAGVAAFAAIATLWFYILPTFNTPTNPKEKLSGTVVSGVYTFYFIIMTILLSLESFGDDIQNRETLNLLFIGVQMLTVLSTAILFSYALVAERQIPKTILQFIDTHFEKKKHLQRSHFEEEFEIEAALLDLYIEELLIQKAISERKDSKKTSDVVIYVQSPVEAQDEETEENN